MIPRKIRSVVVPAVAGLLLAGCSATQKHAAKSKAPDDPPSWDSSPISGKSEAGGDEAGGTGKGFFKSTRLSGALSSEGAEIERSLGVGR